MLQGRDAAKIGKTDRITIAASMIVFVVLVLAVWVLMGIQIHHLRKQRLADSSDPEAGVRVSVDEDDTPLDDLFKSTRRSKTQPGRTSKPSVASWPTTEASNSRPSVQEQHTAQRVDSFFHKVGGAFQKQKSREPGP
ncbi:hypothetical protein F4824DRAFT_342205 [Ustulina deusta]|nr:hypothetical protein F4824DRAFT_342205 [Ustulina deusta]